MHSSPDDWQTRSPIPHMIRACRAPLATQYRNINGSGGLQMWVRVRVVLMVVCESSISHVLLVGVALNHTHT